MKLPQGWRRSALSMMVLACQPEMLPAAGPEVAWFTMRTPGDQHAIQQGSDLCWGRVGRRVGLWTCSDRNGQQSAGRIYLFTPETLNRAKPEGRIIADESFTIVPPAGAWPDFVAANTSVGRELLDDLERRMVADARRGEEPYLDLEALTIGPASDGSSRHHLFVVAEEPFSMVLELALEGAAPEALARVVGVFAYREQADQQGTARNDGLEGLAAAGPRGKFYFAEEGTRDHQGRATSLLLFLDPRLGLADLRDSAVQPVEDLSGALTAAVRGQRKSPMQTLNGICVLGDGRLLVLDRNGGWIHQVDPQSRTAKPWLNLYDLDGQDLRKLLANVPHERHLPYVSIEGLAVDDAGDLWLVDDPAIPEGFRESTLLRIRSPRGLTTPSTTAASRP